MRSREENGFTLIELLIVVAIIGILSALAAAGLLRSRMTANEVSALASLKTVVNAQKAYAASCGSGAYAATFVVLGTPPGSAAAFISADFGLSLAPVRHGFNFTLGAGAGSAAGLADCNGLPTITQFYSSAAPQSLSSGTRSFATNGRNAGVWQIMGLTPPSEPFGAPAEPIR